MSRQRSKKTLPSDDRRAASIPMTTPLALDRMGVTVSIASMAASTEAVQFRTETLTKGARRYQAELNSLRTHQTPDPGRPDETTATASDGGGRIAHPERHGERQSEGAQPVSEHFTAVSESSRSCPSEVATERATQRQMMTHSEISGYVTPRRTRRHQPIDYRND